MGKTKPGIVYLRKNMFRPKSFHLQWHITERCNLHCKHCYSDPALLKNELSLQELIGILNQYVEQIEKWELPKRAVRISFTGGEPFIRKDFFDLLEKCYENRNITQYGILTNGTLLNRSIIKKLKDLKVDYIQVSLEGTKKTNDYIRGKGTFEKIIRAIKLLREERISISISMTVSKTNIQDVPAVINLAKDLKINFLGIRRLVPLGRSKEVKEMVLTPEEVRKLFLYILKIKRDFKANIGIGCEDGILAQEMHYSPVGCSAGYASFTVLPNGDIYPCRRLPLLSGNLLKQSFSNIYYNSKELQRLRNLNNINDVCQSCPFFNECHGGAKCINYAYFGDPFSPSPQCWRIFKELPDPNLKWRASKKEKEKRLDQKWIEED